MSKVWRRLLIKLKKRDNLRKKNKANETIIWLFKEKNWIQTLRNRQLTPNQNHYQPILICVLLSWCIRIFTFHTNIPVYSCFFVSSTNSFSPRLKSFFFHLFIVCCFMKFVRVVTNCALTLSYIVLFAFCITVFSHSFVSIVCGVFVRYFCVFLWCDEKYSFKQRFFFLCNFILLRRATFIPTAYNCELWFWFLFCLNV